MQHRQAFTLVELLVVISIIAILIALLLPSLRQAREASRNIQCQVRLRSLGLAASYYYNEFNGYYPVSATDGMHFLTQLGPYIDPGQANYANSAGMWNASNTADDNLFLCPTSGYKPGTSSPEIYASMAAISSWRVYNYQMNCYFGWHQLTTHPEGSSRRWFSAPPGDFVMMGEVFGSNSSRWPRYDFRWVPRLNMFRHPAESTNLLFLDGHVEAGRDLNEMAEDFASRNIILRPRRWR